MEKTGKNCSCLTGALNLDVEKPDILTTVKPNNNKLQVLMNTDFINIL